MDREHHVELTQLTQLSVGLSQDISLTVEVADGPASYNPERHVITVSRKELEQRGLELCSGEIGHEVGHVLVSRYHHFRVDFPVPRALPLVLNGLEDPRVNLWVCLRFPGISRWLRLLVEDLAARDLRGTALPSFLAFCFGSAGETVWDPTLPPIALPLTPRARAALEATRPARLAYARTIPPAVIADAALQPDLRRRFLDEVVPRLRLAPSPGMAAPTEMGVCLNALEALRIAEAGILPEAARLLQADIAQVDELLQREPRLVPIAEQALRIGDSGAVAAIVRQATDMGERVTPVTEKHGPLATRIVDRFLGTCPQPPSPLVAVATRRPPSGRRRKRLEAARQAEAERLQSHYDAALKRVVGQVAQLTRMFEEVLLPRRRQRLRTGFASGARIDLRRVMASERNPRLRNHLWMRRTVPDRRSAAVLLLVDCSGSMAGEKADASLAGAVLMVETLARLDIAVGVLGFQDEVIPFLPLGERLTQDARRAIGELPLEAAGCRPGPGARNQPSFNDDGPCVRAAADQLLARVCDDRLLIVVSDGAPEGRHSSEQDLRRVIADLMRPEVPLTLCGVGIGSGTRCVSSFYPDSISNVPVSAFSEELGKLLRRVLIGS